MSAPRRARGFTLLEVVIGLALAVIVIGAAMSVLAGVLVSQRRQRVVSELSRDAELVTQLLTQELRQAGLGVPTGGHVVDIAGPTYGTVPRPVTFDDRRLLITGAQTVMILGDIARPDSNYPLFGALHSRPTNDQRILAWHTENNGACIPPGCATGPASVFFPAAAEPTCAAGSMARTCPWALRRLVSGDRLQIVDGTGMWAHASANGTNAGNTGGIVGLPLAADMDASVPLRWANNAPSTGPGGKPGQGWVTSLDRVHYTFDAPNNRIRRTQCFGDPDPNNAAWATPAAVTPATGAAGTCLPSETVARNVQSVAFTYSDAAGTVFVPANATDRNNVRRVQWRIVMSATASVLPNPVTYVTTGSVQLQNIY